MEKRYLQSKEIDDDFYINAILLLKEIKKKYTDKDLKKIKLKNLEILISDLEKYKPKSHMRNGKINVIAYLNHFIEKPINKHSNDELLKLEGTYIRSIFNYRFDKLGYTARGVWIIVLAFTFPIDILLYFFIGKYYFYVPILSIIFSIRQFKKEIKAKKENKLW